MALNILFRRGNTAQNNSFTGELGSITIDTQLRKIRIHDGVTEGGHAVANMTDIEALSNIVDDLDIDDIAGLRTALNLLQSNIDDETLERELQIGSLANLTTTNKTNVVSAINEVKSEADASLKISQNLADIANAQAARQNIDVYSTGEVDDAIVAAKLSLGTNYVVADNDARDALVNLVVGDLVFVQDDGDGKWAHYKVAAVDGNGSGTSYTKISDQDSLENSISATSIKTQYESNADTNAYTDAEKAFVDVSQSLSTDATTLPKAINEVNSDLNTHIDDLTNPHQVTKAQVGLGNADNTSDADKPVSTAQQLALDLKADLDSPALTGTPTAPTPLNNDVSTKLATTQFVNNILGNVENYGIASTVEAEEATSNVKYMTPLRTKELIEGGNYTIDQGTF